MSIQQHSAYHEGFYDAQLSTPLFDDCPSAEYRAGWNSFWEFRAIFLGSAFAEAAE
jgi:hypothetical protein